MEEFLEEPNDQDHFVQQLASCQTQLRGYILAALGNYANTEDVLQRTNLTLWRKADTYEPQGRFLNWAISVAKFEVLRFLRDTRRDRHIFDQDVAELLLATAENQVEKSSGRVDALRECLGNVPSGHRKLLWMRYDEGKSIKEIATESQRSIDSVKSLFLRVRRGLEDCIRARQRADSL